MKTFAQIVEETSTVDDHEDEMLDEGNAMRDWVFDKLENSEMDVDELRAAFKKKFGSSKMKQLDDLMSEFMD